MFTLLDKRSDRTCQGFSRREFLRIGCLGALGGFNVARCCCKRRRKQRHPATL